ncbi:MAG: DUF58 domain-containing protein [Gammaproteobacteria bacterium]|nr:DUF58 domain-containing protein [Gammaproteobacteria bacterium]|tara:strand:+ start:114590 stop:115510 length:921 start_codon:yes stop_codon:yes gene_type:complete
MIELGKTDNRNAPTRLLQPGVLSSLSNLELVAKAVVEGFVMGLHRSPKYGFSQEFVEYRAYTEGDDPRHIDWNVYSRTDKTFIKLFKGETNSHLMLLLDTSASMGFSSASVSKLQYGKYLAASLAYLASRQHDAIGCMTFNKEILEFRPPTSKSGTLHGVIHTLDSAEPIEGTALHKPFTRFREHVKKRGLVAVISDFYCQPEDLQDNVQPLTSHGQDVILFHLLDPGEMYPDIKESTLYEDMETGEAIEVSPIFMKQDYPAKVKAHIAAIQKAAQGMNADHVLIDTSQPLDRALHSYLTFREKRA